MARYIDANVLKEKLLQERDAIPLTRVERYSFGVSTPNRDGIAMRGGVNKALRCLEQTPTADVVPKREVAKANAMGKAMLLDAIDTFRNLLCIEAFVAYEDARKHYFVSLDDVDRIHDELKKKYTEGTNEN